MNRLAKTLVLGSAVIGLSISSSVFASDVKQINGAGASFPYPIYSKWAEAYAAKTGIKLNYQSIGSGGGIKQIKAKTVDFGASDAPLKGEDLAESGLVQFPMVMGGVVPVVNIEGVKSGDIVLDGELLAEIFLGNVSKWNDAKIKAMNPGVNLPDAEITIVHRADGSGTTAIFTDYLKKVSTKWADEVGAGTAVKWPVGLGGKGNEGVASYVGRVKGSIGYVEYAYALQNNLAYTKLKNKDGQSVSPTSEAFQAAAAGADWKSAPGYGVVLTNQPGAASWPITGATFILMHKDQAKPEVAKEVLKFFSWSYHNGQKMADELHYVPMPEAVVNMVEATWAAEFKDASGKAIWDAGMVQK
ncbi:MAG: phosphate ABC transporter substrate-binding protein PstS [Pseudomonadota bacterium]